MFKFIVTFGFQTNEQNAHMVDRFVKDTENLNFSENNNNNPIYYLGKTCFYFGIISGYLLSTTVVIASWIVNNS